MGRRRMLNQDYYKTDAKYATDGFLQDKLKQKYRILEIKEKRQGKFPHK